MTQLISTSTKAVTQQKNILVAFLSNRMSKLQTKECYQSYFMNYQKEDSTKQLSILVEKKEKNMHLFLFFFFFFDLIHPKDGKSILWTKIECNINRNT